MGTRKVQTTANGPGTWTPRIRLPFLLSDKFFFRLQKTAKKQGKDTVQTPRLCPECLLAPTKGRDHQTHCLEPQRRSPSPPHPGKVREKLTVLPNSEGESESESHSVVPNALRPQASLLQGIVPIQGSNPALPHFRQILYQLSHQERSRILERVAYPFSSGSSQPRNRTQVSCIAGGFSTN